MNVISIPVNADDIQNRGVLDPRNYAGVLAESPESDYGITHLHVSLHTCPSRKTWQYERWLRFLPRSIHGLMVQGRT